jgi:GAF domain-containing protein
VHASGDDFFRALAEGIAEALGMKYGVVGQLEPDAQAVRTTAVWAGGRYLDNFVYALRGTPCADVMSLKACFHPAGVHRLFPADKLLVELGIESYFGIPVRGADGQPRGILVAMHDAPRERLGAELEPIFALFAGRAAMELERLEADARLRASEARYRQIVSSCLEGVWALDADGRTTFVNE